MPVSAAPTGITFNAVADPTDSVQLEGSLSDTPSTGGQVRDYGGGRLRWVQGQAVTRSVPVSADTVTPAQLAWLEAHKGQLLCLRDPFGRRYFGNYAGFTATPYPAGLSNHHTVSGLAFQQVTRYESL